MRLTDGDLVRVSNHWGRWRVVATGVLDGVLVEEKPYRGLTGSVYATPNKSIVVQQDECILDIVIDLGEQTAARRP